MVYKHKKGIEWEDGKGEQKKSLKDMAKGDRFEDKNGKIMEVKNNVKLPSGLIVVHSVEVLP